MNYRSFEEIMFRFNEIRFVETFDIIVAIANGGLVPAGIINQRLQIDVQILKINFKDEFQHPRFDKPKLLQPIDFEFIDKKILVVDDRIKSGSTLTLAYELLSGAKQLKSFAVNGNADYALFNEDCFRFPWNL
ncbi:MAG: phosphoribosyltransferase [Porphyromonadaceae bacterium CG2_30_38_12]|nr:MAG: phosphoribosyltransferase [Porphyromonadaceae bacterium CG2_30_38_12]